MADLEQLTRSFDGQRDELLRRFGAKWVVFAEGGAVDAFSEFSDAALLADREFPDRPVRIKRAEARREFVPYILAQSSDPLDA
jgi:hypothetical protein